MLWWNRKQTPEKATRTALRRLHTNLESEYVRVTAKLTDLSDNAPELKALYPAFVRLARTQGAVVALLQDGVAQALETVVNELRGLSKNVNRSLRAEPPQNCSSRQVLARTLKHLIEAEAEISPLMPETTVSDCTTPVQRILLPADLLYQAHHALFPAERMLVAAGRRVGNAVHLGATFDVTGDHGAGHVRAEPKRLARALIAMHLADTHLACWLHSHPGTGPEATRPSTIDLNQHRDWIRDFSPALLSAILVEDGWVRLWGTSLEAGETLVEVVGSGIIKERNDEHLYRLAE
jgi:hypothetical protein